MTPNHHCDAARAHPRGAASFGDLAARGTTEGAIGVSGDIEEPLTVAHHEGAENEEDDPQPEREVVIRSHQAPLPSMNKETPPDRGASGVVRTTRAAESHRGDMVRTS